MSKDKLGFDRSTILGFKRPEASLLRVDMGSQELIKGLFDNKLQFPENGSWIRNVGQVNPNQMALVLVEQPEFRSTSPRFVVGEMGVNEGVVVFYQPKPGEPVQRYEFEASKNPLRVSMEITVGRAPTMGDNPYERGLTVSDNGGAMSRTHFKIHYAKGWPMGIVDLASRNGTWVAVVGK